MIRLRIAIAVLICAGLAAPSQAQDWASVGNAVMTPPRDVLSVTEKLLHSEMNRTPYLAHLVSEYCDDASGACGDKQAGRNVAVSGSGFVMACVDCGRQPGTRYFLVTASHVSQGQNFNADLGEGERPRILGRLADNLHDVEVMEIATPKPENVLAYYSRFPDDLPSVDPLRGWTGGDGPRLYGKPEDLLSTIDPGSSVKINHSSRYREDVYIPAPPWAKYHPQNAPKYENDLHDDSVTGTLVGNELTFPGEISPGMSGAPVLRTQRKGFTGKVTVIDGVVSRKVRGFDISFASSSTAIRNLLKSFLDGKRGLIGPTQWRYASGVGTYRNFGNGSAEIDLHSMISRQSVFQPTGNGTGSDGGNGTGSDGGNGTGSDGGNGVGSGNEISPAGSVMIWQGQSIRGFNVKGFDPKAPERSTFIFGDKTAVDYLAQAGNQVSVQPVAATSPLSAVIQERFKLPKGPFKMFTVPEHLWGASELGEAVLRTRQLAPDSATIQFDGRNFHLDLKDEKIHLEWSDVGPFAPIMRADANGKTYEVDLHQIFFSDLAMLPGTQMEFARIGNPNESLSVQMGIASMTPVVRVREVGSASVKLIPLWASSSSQEK